jgi:3-deoxy-manno-octulosonate cytidylyltransferase (CMP-KDO synthetase)
MIIGLIPARLKSSRLPNKPLLLIDNMPLIMHTLRRAQLCKDLDRVIVCADSSKIIDIVKKYRGEATKTSTSHTNGTERIAEVVKKIKKKIKLVIDIQCDEVFLKPNNIKKLINFHKKNNHFDIVVPHTEIYEKNNESIVKILKKKNNVIYMSRLDVPYNYYTDNKKIPLLRHMDIISFKPKSLIKFSKLKKSALEKIENIELLRGIENNFKIGTFLVQEDDFSINTKNDYIKAKKEMKSCKIRKMYKLNE